MEGGPSTAQFEHDTIPDGGRHIRLLEIQEIDPDGHVVCRLTTWPVAGAPAYYALSYTWGSPVPTYWISINTLNFPAGEDCVYALKQAFSSKASQYYWMDALCINQNTTMERSHQVGMMAQIYARSVHVLACVG
ncbi:heterokaryon incompatibility protein-domain-containing protein, partial [Alternaria rosae]|uniref:heterokaryon incompatibility protein-domain-containing protein n=1 Tax=Alternaria rosae TaxID=1187941 RepID=UPI001E8CB8BC